MLEEFDSDAEYLEESKWTIGKRRQRSEIADAFELSSKRLKETLQEPDSEIDYESDSEKDS